MKATVRWLIIGVVSVLLFLMFVFVGSPQAMYRVLIFGAGVVTITAIFLTPTWILISCLIVKRAVDSAFHNDFDKVRMFLSRYWLPVPKCKEIVRILRQLCVDRKHMPKDFSPEFADCIVLDEWGNYVLSWEGKEKMISKVNSGWFTAKKAEDLSSPKTLGILMRLVMIVAVIRGIALIFQLFSRH